MSPIKNKRNNFKKKATVDVIMKDALSVTSPKNVSTISNMLSTSPKNLPQKIDHADEASNYAQNKALLKHRSN